jgi:dTDP-glucose 4,6-dehydratase
MNESALDGGVYNVGTMEEFYIVDLVKLIAKMMGIENPRINFEGVRSADPRRRLLSVEKIQKAVGWEARVTLDQGLRDCIANRMAR